MTNPRVLFVIDIPNPVDVAAIRRTAEAQPRPPLSGATTRPDASVRRIETVSIGRRRCTCDSARVLPVTASATRTLPRF